VVTSSAGRAAKKAKLEAILAATALADCKVELMLANGSNANCYGPNMTFTSHPDGSPASGSLPGGDTGIWEESDATPQACAAAQLNQRIQGSASYADAGLFSTAAMLCAARVSGVSEPAVGVTENVTTYMTGLLKINATDVTVSSATISREADTSGGFPVYVSQIVGTAGTTTYTIRMKHNPTGPATSRNDTFVGKVSVKIATADGTKPQNCNSSSATGHTIATSVAYERSSSTAEKYLVKDAQFCGDDADPFVSATDFTVDHSKVLSGGTPKGWANNANYLAASIDPTTDAGNYAYAWQAGAGDSNVRALSTNIADSSGTLTGTAFFGFGDPISTSGFDGDITKMICNWAGSGSSHTGVSKAQKQTMTRASGATVFTVGTSNITYDPVNACEDASSFTVNWTKVDTTSGTQVASATTENLVAVSTISATYTTPSAPTAVE